MGERSSGSPVAQTTMLLLLATTFPTLPPLPLLLLLLLSLVRMSYDTTVCCCPRSSSHVSRYYIHWSKYWLAYLKTNAGRIINLHEARRMYTPRQRRMA